MAATSGDNGATGNRVTPQAVRAMLRDGDEIAFLDVREEGVFSEAGHPFFAHSVPLSRLELMIGDLVPRHGTRLVVHDGGAEGLAERAAAKLAALGYRDVAVMAGGAPAWGAAGFELFTGVNVPSKAFGELVEHRCGTPHIAAAELKRRIDAGEKVLIVDSRPIGEFRNMSIPGAFDCPGAELVYRVPDKVPEPDTLVVVNCAGRTRSIIGAQSLRNARLANPVMALENGTMGWELAGLQLARGREEALPVPSPAGLAKAHALADDVAARFGIQRIDDAAFARLTGEAAQRTLYVFDVRSPEEYAAGHLATARSAPGGQLVQATDVYMATRNARIVLVDDDGVRSVMTGSWLVQMGPIAGAELDVWQAQSNGLYDSQDKKLDGLHMRGKFRTDDDGCYFLRTVRPVNYPIPSDGPVGAMLQATGRHPWRPAHIHFVVSAAGYEPVTTHIFDRTDPYLASDAVFAVKDALVVDFTRHETPDPRAAAAGIAGPYLTTEFDFRLDAAMAEAPATAIDAQRRLAALGVRT
ncbi:MAG TPA: rhodanese-like domain-containing protein [Stellaceae bacterium]|jgi:rhodanese-related sulfurtransferase|nr:rhodanese-like domain-containing protein [Stellaceae bacterium]